MGVKVILLVIFCSDGSGWDLFSETYKKCRRLCWVDVPLDPGSLHLRMGLLIFRRLYLSDMRVSLDGNTELHPHGFELGMQFLEVFWPGLC